LFREKMTRTFPPQGGFHIFSTDYIKVMGLSSVFRGRLH
jgi:hypothetical protein